MLVLSAMPKYGLAAVCLAGLLATSSCSHPPGDQSARTPTPQLRATPTPTPAKHRVNVNGEVFIPDPAAAPTAALSAQEAFADYSNGRTVPSDVIAQYGTLIASESHYVHVWAYTENGGCWSGYGPTPLPVPPDGYCTTWTFLDPATGAEIDSTQQN